MNTEQIREEVRSWLAANWDPNLNLIEWRELLTDSGWGAPDWPSDYFGRDLAPQLSSVVDEELARIGAIGAAHSGVRMLAAVTLLAHGNHEQKQNYLRTHSYRRTCLVPVVQRARQWFRFSRCYNPCRSGRRRMDY